MGEDEGENLKNVEEVSLCVADEIRAAVSDIAKGGASRSAWGAGYEGS